MAPLFLKPDILVKVFTPAQTPITGVGEFGQISAYIESLGRAPV